MRRVLTRPGSGSTPNVLLPMRNLWSARANSCRRRVTSTLFRSVPYRACRMVYWPVSPYWATAVVANRIENKAMFIENFRVFDILTGLQRVADACAVRRTVSYTHLTLPTSDLV